MRDVKTTGYRSHLSVHARRLATAMAAVAAFAGTPVTPPAYAAPSDITESAAPVAGAEAPKATAINGGDASVSTSTGALTFGFPITLPPGRQGAQPQLSLSYSSQGSIYGGIAAGWPAGLGIPAITEDTSQGRLRTHYGLAEAQQSDPRLDDKFVSSLAGGRPLYRVAEFDPPPAGVYGVYRAQSDGSYARYERMQPVAGGAPDVRWRVRTQDGATLYFGDNHAGTCQSRFGDGYAPLTKSEDVYGNTVTYNYSYDAASDECRIDTITYGANANAGITNDFARVTFVYGAVETCNGSGVAVGSQVDYRTGRKMVTGAAPLTTIRMEAMPSGVSSGTAVHTREVLLGYATPGYAAGVCTSSFAPYRILTSIQERAWGTNMPLVTLPAVTMEYGSAVIARTASNNNLLSLPRGNHNYDRWPSITEMNLDMDGDGLPNDMWAAFDATTHKCQAKWSAANGSIVTIDLPMIPSAAIDPNYPTTAEDCALNYHRAYAQTTTNTGTLVGCHHPSYMGYRWTDIDQDGKIDLISALQISDCYQPNMNPTVRNSLYGLPALPTNNGAEYCGGVQPYTPRCVSMSADCANPTTTCGANAMCNALWSPMMSNACTSGAAAHDCLLADSYGATVDPTVVPSGATPSMYAAKTNQIQEYGRCGEYPWFVYKNGEWATKQVIWQPVPLESEQGDASLGGAASSSTKLANDIDGDGTPDMIALGRNNSPTAVAQPWWWHSFLNDGTGKLQAQDYLVRGFDGGKLQESAYLTSLITGNEAALDSITLTTLADLNGDGLADYLRKGKSTTNSAYDLPISVAFNDGSGLRLKNFSATAGADVRGEVNLPAHIQHVSRQRVINGQWIAPTGTSQPGGGGKWDVNGGMIFKPTSPGRLKSGDRYSMERLVDIDADGRPDLVSMGTNATGTPVVAFNLGGTFGPYNAMPGSGVGAPNWVQILGDQTVGTWTTKADFVDLDGDGITEYLQSGTVKRYNPGTQPPRLLHTIHNGRGADTLVQYASMHNIDVVTQDPANGYATPKTQWVVKTLTSTDALTPTTVANGPYAASTTYKYINPRHLKDEGRYEFRGFDQVIATNVASGARTVSVYDYAVDPTGRLVETRMHPTAGSEAVSTIQQTSYAKVAIFGTSNPAWEGLTNFYPAEERSYICNNNMLKDACIATPAAFAKTVTTMSSFGTSAAYNINTVANTADFSPLFWLPSSVRVSSSAGTAVAEGDRTSTSAYSFTADANTYRVRPTTVTKTVRTGAADVLFGKSEQVWRADLKVLLESRVWTNTVDTDRLVTKFGYDDTTGNLLWQQKPAQVAASSTLKQTFTYDARKQFVVNDTNEMNISLDYEWEPGTGAKLATKGPNNRTCVGGGCPAVTALSPAREEHRVDVDALGRTLRKWDTLSDSGDIYNLVKLSETTYTDAPNLTSTPKAPASVYTTSLIELGSTVWTQEQSDIDGHGRPIRKVTFAQGTAPVDAISTFTYSNQGTLVALTLPDPTQNNAATVTYTYTYDSLGRATGMRRPDNGVPGSQSGVDMTYDGVTQTVTEVVGAGGGNVAEKVTIADSFGRLSQVKERTQVMANNPYQTTTYTYAADDTVRTITDPEANVTTLTHDFAGRRTAIERAGKTWSYGYDRNGNMTSELVPGSTPSTVAQYTTLMTYDAGDRLLTKTLAPRALSAADQTLFGASTVKYTWDYGGNRMGRLRYTQSYGPSTTVPTVATDYQYDAMGHTTFVNHTFKGAGYNFTRQYGANYTPWGGVRYTYYRDYVGGANETKSRTYYDARAMPSRIDLERTGATTQVMAQQTRNVAGLVTKRRTDQVAATGPMPWIESNWAYDTLGRVTSQTVQKGANVGGAPEQVAKQVLAYLGNDDPSTLVHTLGPATGVVNSKTFTFGYDLRHQLTSAVAAQSALGGTGPFAGGANAFLGTYDYGNAGRLTKADVGVGAAALTGSEVKTRKVDYCYHNTDKEQVSALRLITTGTTTHCDAAIRDPHDAVEPGELSPNQTAASPTYASYRYDAAGNQTERFYPGGSPASGSGASSETFLYVYDGEDRLRRVTKKVAGVVMGSEEYWYDEQGARVGVLKRDGAGTKQELRWFIGDTQAHYDAAGVVTKVYSHLSLGTPIARVERTGNANTATNVEYQFHGLASNTLAAVGADGVINANMAYAPYGELIEATERAAPGGAAVGIAAHRRRMNDKYVDELGGLTYYGARYYDNLLIGWTQADPKYRFAPDAAWAQPRRANLYMFTLGNPMRYVDPDGRDGESATGEPTSPEPTQTVTTTDTTDPKKYDRVRKMAKSSISKLSKSVTARQMKMAGVKVDIAKDGDKPSKSKLDTHVLLMDRSKGSSSNAVASKLGKAEKAFVEEFNLKENKNADAFAQLNKPVMGIDLNLLEQEIANETDEDAQAYIDIVVEHEFLHRQGVDHPLDEKTVDPTNMMDRKAGVPVRGASERMSPVLQNGDRQTLRAATGKRYFK